MNQAGELHRNARQLYATGHPTVEQHLVSRVLVCDSGYRLAVMHFCKPWIQTYFKPIKRCIHKDRAVS